MDDQQVPTVQKMDSAQSYVDEREVWGRMDTCIYMVESVHCSPETITTLLTGCIPIQNKKLGGGGNAKKKKL